MNHNQYLKYYFFDAIERAVKTGAQTALATLGANGMGIYQMSAGISGKIVLGATLASFLTSVVQYKAWSGATTSYPGATVLAPPASAYSNNKKY